MPLIPFTQMLNVALEKKYAVGYFEAWNGDSLEVIVAAAEETDSPIIIGFGGMTVNQDWFDDCGLESLAALGRVAAARSEVPVCFILNEVRTIEHCRRGIDLGFNIVMLDSSHMSFKDNVEVTGKLVNAAHARNVAVEAELGRLPEAGKESSSALTDPDQAAEFVRETNVDALAVSIGNVHLLTAGEAAVDLDLLGKIREKTRVPLVIHGGSGFPAGLVRKCINLGVAKFNVGTIIKKEYYLAIRSAMQEQASNPDIQRIVGSREREDFTHIAKLNVKTRVAEMLKLYGSAGKAKGGRLVT